MIAINGFPTALECNRLVFG